MFGRSTRRKFTDDRQFSYLQSEQLKLESATITGWRDDNEDTHLATILSLPEIEGHPPLYLKMFGVFDGHGGGECSKVVSKKIVKWLMDSVAWKEYESQRQENIPATESDTDLMVKAALFETFNSADTQPEMTGFKDQGTTCIIVVITSTSCIIANCGDSKAVLYGEDFEILMETTEHRPDDPKERRRIIKNGGYIWDDRVCGDLSLTRALGDIKYKMLNPEIQDLVKGSGEKVTGDLISACPDITIFPIDDVKKILLICDGYTECEDIDGITRVLSKSKKSSKDTEKITGIQSLMQSSIEWGSKDNMTAIYIHLDEELDVFNGNDFSEIPHWSASELSGETVALVEK